MRSSPPERMCSTISGAVARTYSTAPGVPSRARSPAGCRGPRSRCRTLWPPRRGPPRLAPPGRRPGRAPGLELHSKNLPMAIDHVPVAQTRANLRRLAHHLGSRVAGLSAPSGVCRMPGSPGRGGELHAVDAAPDLGAVVVEPLIDLAPDLGVEPDEGGVEPGVLPPVARFSAIASTSCGPAPSASPMRSSACSSITRLRACRDRRRSCSSSDCAVAMEPSSDVVAVQLGLRGQTLGNGSARGGPDRGDRQVDLGMQREPFGGVAASTASSGSSRGRPRPRPDAVAVRRLW